MKAFVQFAVAFALCVAGATGAHAAEGYLKKAPLGYQVPLPPAQGSETSRMDLAMVEAAQTMPASHAWQEANGDARAYDADKVIRRFEDAWGDALTADKRPILIHVLTRVIQDTSDYAALAKAGAPRPRPYVGHPEIVPCDRGPPEHPIKDNESYPSACDRRAHNQGE